ncbi:hypothetical protein [Oceanobacillus timonensis]|uniref:hypothetical protein n=1 Tax=Oceanobacillus timonensis TaxID=1926285 RepID=UPI0009BB0BC0|nr:hypothetical protein [Oceanobacillus timonensis]
MEKVSLTQEQLEKIESELDGTARSEVKLLARHTKCVVVDDNDTWINDYKCLNKISVEDMAKILFVPGSYEVIPQFKVGEWVRHDDGEVGKITKIEESSGQTLIFIDIEDIKRMYFWEEKYICDPERFFRHATPEEIQQEKKRRFWDRIGRKEDEYKEDDFIVDEHGDYGFIESKKTTDIYRVRMIRSNQSVVTHFEEMRLVTKADERLDK